MDNFFASVYSDHQGYNVLVFEVDRTNDKPVLRLHLSESSDLLAVEPIADIIKLYTAKGLDRCYFNFVESNIENLVANGVRELIGGESILLKANENPAVSLEKLALKINGTGFKVKEGLDGRIHTDRKHADVDNMSHQIANLIHVTDNWDRIVNGDSDTIAMGEPKDRFDDLDGYVDFDRRRL